MRYAAIDIGSNAVRLLIADTVENSSDMTFKKNTLIRVPLRLGDDVFVNRMIPGKKINDLQKVMLAFRNLMEVYKVEDYMACATSAMREALNGTEVVEKVKEFSGVQIHIVSGKAEASIIYSSHVESYIGNKLNYLYIDVGGGSTELSIFSEGKPVVSQSFKIGTIRILSKMDEGETWQQMKEWIKTNSTNFKKLSGIGTGGNINKLFKMSEEKDGRPLSLSKLTNLYNYLNSYSLEDRINTLGLNDDRADVIIPAAEIFITVMKWAGVKQIYVPRVGMVDGIVQMLIEKNMKNEQ